MSVGFPIWELARVDAFGGQPLCVVLDRIRLVGAFLPVDHQPIEVDDPARAVVMPVVLWVITEVFIRHVNLVPIGLIVTQSLFQKGGLERRKGMNPKPYPSDLTSQQWAVLKPLLPPARTGGRPRKTEMRSVVNAIFYRNRNGCIWRALPHDFPPWRTVYNYFAAWKRDGTWKAINDALRRRVRQRAGRQPTPTPAVSIARPSR